MVLETQKAERLDALRAADCDSESALAGRAVGLILYFILQR
jgi:hypothetical protein